MIYWTAAITTLLLTRQVRVEAKGVGGHNDDSSTTRTLPLLSHHHMLERRNLQRIPNPGVTEIHNIPIARKLDGTLGSDRNLEVEDGDGFNTLEVNGLYQGYGTHYVDLWVGTPPQRQTVIVDTGSGVTAFPCQDCTNCGKDYHASDVFHESQSTTFQKFTCDQCQHASCSNGGSNNEFCHVSVSYQEGSMWSAFQGMDITYVGGLHDGAVKKKEEGSKLGGQINGEDPLSAAQYDFNMVFGCQTRITKLFLTQLADGIMGMCLKDSAIWKQMHNQNVIDKQSFAMCFVRADDAAKDGSMAGTLTMGGADTKLHEKEMIYAKGFKTKGVMHGVRVRKMHIMKSEQYNSESATEDNTITINISEDKLNSGSIIVDSGTTDTYFTSQLRGPFKAAFKELVGYDYNTSGMTLSTEQVQALPTILIQLVGIPNASMNEKPGLAMNLDPENPDDILIAIPPAHYIEYDSDRKKYVGRFSVDEGRGSVIGANTMRGHDVLFDIPENGRIGFAVSDCDYRNLMGLEIAVENAEADEHNINHHADDASTDADIDEKGDDYYKESENQKLTETNGLANDFEDSTGASDGSTCDDRCKVGATLGVAVVAFIALTVYRRTRQKAGYQNALAENQILNDLHLDTEIQMTEIS